MSEPWPSTLDLVLDALREKRDLASEQYGVDILGVFGSVARGEDDPRSDVDVLISASPRTDMFHLGALWSELSDALNRRVDLVDRAGLRPALRAHIETEMVSL